jgi:small subunit ribosomal protein S8
MVNDNISNFITRLRNAVLVRHKIVETTATKMTIAITKILKNEGFIEDFEIIENGIKKSLLLFLKYKDRGRKPTITFLKRISKPGRRIYVNKKNLPKTIGVYGLSIMSTSNGIMTDKKARLTNVGGEVLLYIY